MRGVTNEVAAANASAARIECARLLIVYWVQLEIVRCSVGVNYCLLTLFSGPGISVLHPNNARIPLRVNVFEDVLVVHFTGCRLLATRIIPNLEVSDLSPRTFDVGDNITFRDLLVVHVKEYLTCLLYTSPSPRDS